MAAAMDRLSSGSVGLANKNISSYVFIQLNNMFNYVLFRYQLGISNKLKHTDCVIFCVLNMHGKIDHIII